MSDDNSPIVNTEGTEYNKSASYVFLKKRLTTVSDRKCILFTNKMNKSDYLVIMQTADCYPEFVNDRTPSEPGYNYCEVYAVNKNISKAHLNLDNFTPWHKGGNKRTLERHHSYYYQRQTSGDFTPSPKETSTHVLRITVISLASCPALSKKIYRISSIKNVLVNCAPSLIVYTFEPGHERPVPNLPACLKRKALDNLQKSANIPSSSSMPVTSAQEHEHNTDEFNAYESRFQFPKRQRTPSVNYDSNESFSMIEPKQEIRMEASQTAATKQESIDNHQSLFNVQTPIRSSSSSFVQHSNQRKFQNYEMFSAGVISNAMVPSPMFHPHITPIADIENEERYDPEELTQRNKLAALYRLVDLFRWSQGIYNHITVRVSTDPDEILINAFGQLYNEVSASSLIKVDLDGTVIDGGSTHFGVNQAGYVLHSAIHNGRPEVKCVVHLHHPSVVAVSAQKCGLLPISQEAMIVGEVGYHEYRGILIDEAERALLIRDLGERNVMILRNHGFVVCGESIEHALSLTYHLIIACETQVKTVPGGNTDNVHFPAQSAIKQVYKVASNGGGGVNRQNGHVNSTQWRKGELEWQAYMRQLDAQGYSTGHVYN